MTAQHRSWEDSAVQNAYPDYYPLFRCIADRCRHNCCIGWEIDVDGDSLAAYDQIGGEMGERLHKCIDRSGEMPHFILDEHERCPFLNGKNLCDLILYGGEGMLCQICTDHPRYRSFFSERTEIGVGLCCEEAARLILTKPEKTTLVVTGEGELDEEETALLTLRDRLFTLAQTVRNRSSGEWSRFYRPAVRTCRASRSYIGQSFISRSSAWTRRGQTFWKRCASTQMSCRSTILPRT